MAIEDLAEAPSLKEALKQDKAQYDDCTPCRIVGEQLRTLPASPVTPMIVSMLISTFLGSAVFIGAGAYTYTSGHAQLKAQEAVIRKSRSMFGMASRRAAITGTSAFMVGLGVYRWFA
jgi:hypothetical protein